MEKKLKTPRVQWHISGDVECPYCEHDNDFMQVDEYYDYSQPGENKDKFFMPVEMTCDNCKKDFKVDGSDY